MKTTLIQNKVDDLAPLVYCFQHVFIVLLKQFKIWKTKLLCAILFPDPRNSSSSVFINHTCYIFLKLKYQCLFVQKAVFLTRSNVRQSLHLGWNILWNHFLFSVLKTRGPGALYRAQEYHCNLVLFFFKIHEKRKGKRSDSVQKFMWIKHFAPLTWLK